MWRPFGSRFPVISHILASPVILAPAVRRPDPAFRGGRRRSASSSTDDDRARFCTDRVITPPGRRAEHQDRST